MRDKLYLRRDDRLRGIFRSFDQMNLLVQKAAATRAELGLALVHQKWRVPEDGDVTNAWILTAARLQRLRQIFRAIVDTQYAAQEIRKPTWEQANAWNETTRSWEPVPTNRENVFRRYKVTGPDENRAYRFSITDTQGTLEESLTPSEMRNLIVYAVPRLYIDENRITAWWDAKNTLNSWEQQPINDEQDPTAVSQPQ